MQSVRNRLLKRCCSYFFFGGGDIFTPESTNTLRDNLDDRLYNILMLELRRRGGPEAAARSQTRCERKRLFLICEVRYESTARYSDRRNLIMRVYCYRASVYECWCIGGSKPTAGLKAGNASVAPPELEMSIGGGDHLLSGGRRARSRLKITIKKTEPRKPRQIVGSIGSMAKVVGSSRPSPDRRGGLRVRALPSEIKIMWESTPQ
ncbi:hypothetical protein EVAR_15838_1 [Eumeta japonica]|uniref:Uncharacterized protein n=1 Tax=Eumeta variegata TaxID=151549 RepID=A0A4C1UF80_EUMVA|nr:hypothetical protein EVAR_15838_1 [Eumeta japonica]